MIWLRVILICFWFLVLRLHIIETSGISISGNFKECSAQKNAMHLTFDRCRERKKDLLGLNFKNNTKWRTLETWLDSFKHLQAFVFSKHKMVLEGMAYECSLKIHKYWFETDIFFQVHTSSEQEVIQLSQFQCYDMIRNQKCGKTLMRCKSNSSCSFKEQMVTKKHPVWWSTNYVVLHECNFHQRLIVSANHDKKVIPSATSSCLANDHFCALEGSVVVWSRDILRACLFEKLLYMDDLQKNNMGVFVSLKHHLAFNFTLSSVTDCGGITYWETHEGLYITFPTNAVEKRKIEDLPTSQIPSVHLDNSDYRKLEIAEKDFTTMKEYESLLKLLCASMENLIRSNLDTVDKYLVINEMGLSEFIVYINDGVAYLPLCRIVDRIEIMEKPINCYKDFAITYTTIDHVKKTGFLRADGIITHQSTMESCNNNDRNLMIDDASIIVQRKNNLVTVSNTSSALRTNLKVSIVDKVIANIMEHNKILMNESNVLETMNDLLAAHEGDIIYYVKPNDFSFHIEEQLGNKDTKFKKTDSLLVQYIKHVYHSIKTTLFFFLIVIGLMLTGYVVFKVVVLIKGNPEMLNFRIFKDKVCNYWTEKKKTFHSSIKALPTPVLRRKRRQEPREEIEMTEL